MKNIKILSSLASLALLWGASACQSPQEIASTEGQPPINSITASFLGDQSLENKFNAEIDLENGEIRVIFPYNYPLSSDNQITQEQLSKVRVVANIHNNVSFTPSLGIMDLNKEHVITMHDQFGVDHKLRLYAEIRKSAECDITEFTYLKKVWISKRKFRFDTIAAIPNAAEAIVNVLNDEDNLGEGTGRYKLSHHATISPEPSDTLDYNEGIEFTVTAQNGVDKKTWLVKRGIPPMLKRGLRSNSGKLLWAVKLSDLGYNGRFTAATENGVSVVKQHDQANGLAPTGDVVLVNQVGNPNPVVLSRKDGSIVGRADFSEVAPYANNTGNYCVTADDAGHIIICNNDDSRLAAPNFKIWWMENWTSKPKELVTTKVAYNFRGHHISVCGDVTKNAIITTGLNGPMMFSRWVIKDGVLESQDSEAIDLGAYFNGMWSCEQDVMYIKPNKDSDYFGSGYGSFNSLGALPNERYVVWYRNNKPFALSPHALPNYMADASRTHANWVNGNIDYIEFNKVGYVLDQRVDIFNWGHDDIDCLLLYDAVSGKMQEVADFTDTGININEKYGAKYNGNLGSIDGSNGIEMQVSEDGYYLYIYFMFNGGYVGCVSFDCFDM